MIRPTDSLRSSSAPPAATVAPGAVAAPHSPAFRDAGRAPSTNDTPPVGGAHPLFATPGLTSRQRKLWLFGRDYAAQHGIGPSYAEMTVALGLKSKQGPHRIVNSLAERGYARKLSSRARSVEFVEPASVARHTAAIEMLAELQRIHDTEPEWRLALALKIDGWRRKVLA